MESSVDAPHPSIDTYSHLSQDNSLLFAENLQKDAKVLNFASFELERDLENILCVFLEHGFCDIVLSKGQKCKIYKDVNFLLPFPG